MARVPRNGRNFEYLSGEDPSLGATLVKQVDGRECIVMRTHVKAEGR